LARPARHWKTLVGESNLQNIRFAPNSGARFARLHRRAGTRTAGGGYSQIELRLLAHYSKDKLLVEAFRRGDDIHTLTASQVFGVPPLMVTPEHRRAAKVVNFGIVYGLSAFGLSQQLGITTSEAKKFIDAYFEKYSGVRAFIDATLEQARREQKVTSCSDAFAHSRHQQQESKSARLCERTA